MDTFILLKKERHYNKRATKDSFKRAPLKWLHGAVSNVESMKAC